MPDKSMNEARRQAAVQFLQLVVSGRIDEAYERHVDMRGKHHNPFFPAGFPALKKAMAENDALFPTKQICVRNVLCDGDLVAVHSDLVLSPGQTEMTVVHLLRFEGEKIVEFWDCGQPLPAKSPNKDGAF